MLVDLHGQNAHQSLLAADLQRALRRRVRRLRGARARNRRMRGAIGARRVAKRDAATARSAGIDGGARASRSAPARARSARGDRRRVDGAVAGPDAARARRRAARSRGRRGRGACRRRCRAGAPARRTDREARRDRRPRPCARRDRRAARACAHRAHRSRARAPRLSRQARSRSGGARRASRTRLAAIHDVARKYRVRPEALPELLVDTEARLEALADSADVAALDKRVAIAEAAFRALADELSRKRELAANELETRVTDAMQELAMKDGRLEIALVPLAAPASYGNEQIDSASRAIRSSRWGRSQKSPRAASCRGSRSRSRS